MNILITSIVDLKKTAHNRLHQFIKHLSKNHDITVLSINDCWKNNQTDITLYNRDFENLLQKINIIEFTNKKISPINQELLSIGIIPKLLKNINYKDFDIHFNYNTLFSGYFISKKMKSIGVDTIYDLADDLVEMVRNSPQINIFLRGFGAQISKIMVKKNIDISDKVTVINDMLTEKFKISKKKFKIIPNGVDIKLFKNYESEDIRKKLGLVNNFVIGYVGVLREWVNLAPVFKSISKLKKLNIKILIVGEEGRFKENKKLVKKMNISSRVIFTGTISYTEVPKYISCMDVCVIPFDESDISKNSLPLKLFEYMACEKPVISTNLNGVRNAVGDRVLYASNEKGYENEIKKLYSNENLRKKMGIENRSYVKNNYSWSKIINDFEKNLKKNVI